MLSKKTPVLESVFNKVAGLQLSCKYWEIFKNSFFHKTPPVSASENISFGEVIDYLFNKYG